MCLGQMLLEALWVLELIPQPREYLAEDAVTGEEGRIGNYWWKTNKVPS